MVKKLSKLFLTLSLCFLTSAVCLKLWSIPSVANAITLATTVKQESFTELYFEDHLKLPTTVVSNKVYFFKFTIHNLENQDMTYPYEVYADIGDGQKLFIDKDTASLHNNESKTIEEKFMTGWPFQKMKVSVNLINKNQQIDFWVEGENLQ